MPNYNRYSSCVEVENTRILLVQATSRSRQSLGVANPKKGRKPILRHRKLIGETIRHYRKVAGFTQEKMAEAADLNPKYADEIERGEKIISIEALLRIAKAVKTPVRDFFRDI